MEQEIKMLKRNNKILMGILIIFILLCIGLGVYFLFIISKLSNNIVGEMTKLATEKVISQTDNLNESGLYTITHSADSTLQIGTTESVTEYRYRGASPKNYVSFNNETWRIIGVFPTEDENGNIDVEKMEIITFDMTSNTYRFLCGVVGKAFKDGLRLK